MEETKKFHPAVLMGRRGGVVKSEAKTIAARLNGLKGGARSWKTPVHLRKKTGPKPKGTVIKIRKPKRKIRITEVVIAEQAPQ